MSALLPVAVVGWLCSAAFAFTVARLRAGALARGERLAGVVHELRGPLQAAMLIVASARRGAPPATAGALSALEVELGRLTLAVGDLEPAAAAAASDPGATAACDVAELVADLAPGWALLGSAHGRAVRVHPIAGPARARGERLRLAQALGNLVANALEHGAGDVDVRVGVGADGGVQAEVCDAGPGLPATVHALVARPPDPCRPRGRGLGIAAAIAADAGGRLAGAPAARGARLLLQLPPAPPDPVAGAFPTRPVAS